MKKIKALDFDNKFDNNEDIEDHVDWSKAKRINEAPMRVAVDFPKWMVASLDKEAQHLGLSRQAIIKLSVAEHLQERKRA